MTDAAEVVNDFRAGIYDGRETFEAKGNPQELETVYDIQSGSRTLNGAAILRTLMLESRRPSLHQSLRGGRILLCLRNSFFECHRYVAPDLNRQHDGRRQQQRTHGDVCHGRNHHREFGLHRIFVPRTPALERQ